MFEALPAYGYAGDTKYSLLPFRFDRREDGRYFLSNEVGEFIVVTDQTLRQLVSHQLLPSNPSYFDLKARHFLFDSQSSAHLDVLAAKYRTKKSFLDGFTKLHIFVTTLRCNQSCPYCQVSRQGADADSGLYDMSSAVLDAAIKLMLATPAPHITMEFQGGEPLVRFDLLQEAVRRTLDRNNGRGKQIDFVVCTNLSTLEDHHLDFFSSHHILISTSLDGPKEVHDKNRPLGRAQASHEIVTRNIRRAQEALGKHAVSALMTTTRASLHHPTEIVDEYLRLDLGSLFVRELNPYGFYRNLPFVSHVALMGLENMGYTKKNVNLLWVDPLDYAKELEETVRALFHRQMSVSVYNLQLCVLPRATWPFARQSISDYKNIFLPTCSSCTAQPYCAGLFASSESLHSRGIRPIEMSMSELKEISLAS